MAYDCLILDARGRTMRSGFRCMLQLAAETVRSAVDRSFPGEQVKEGAFEQNPFEGLKTLEGQRRAARGQCTVPTSTPAGNAIYDGILLSLVAGLGGTVACLCSALAILLWLITGLAVFHPDELNARKGLGVAEGGVML